MIELRLSGKSDDVFALITQLNDKGFNLVNCAIIGQDKDKGIITAEIRLKVN